MRNPARSPFVAIVHTEILFNLRRVAPYALAILFSANAVLWWGWGPAIGRGWATNSEFFIAWLFGGFSFMTMPLFIAVMMGDPVVRDFRVGIDPLIFSKPVSRAEYLCGKFFGNFLVLVCCQACFALTLVVLQSFDRPGMVVLPPRIVPYVTNFFFFVVVSSLALAAFCFTVGTLTRNVKVVYGLVTCFYFVYVAWQISIKGLPQRWRVILDPLLFNWGGEIWKGRSAAWLNQLGVDYDGDMIANRALMLLVSAACLGLLHFRFSRTERAADGGARGRLTTINLSEPGESVYGGDSAHSAARHADETFARKSVAIPNVRTATEGLRANLKQLAAALGVELRLLRAERGLVLLAPLATLLCVMGLAYYEVAPEVSYSATYAFRTAESLLLFLFGIAVFYAGESLHRDRELRIEPVLRGTPAPDFVLLLSKFAATLLLSLALMALVALAAVAVQVYKGHGPIDARAYLLTYIVILAPSAAFMVAAAVALNVVLRDKYLAYAACLGAGGALLYLYTQGHNHKLYNFVLYQLWTPADLSGDALGMILAHRIYCLAASAAFLSLAHLCFGRSSTRRLRAGGRLSGAAWSLVALVASLLVAAAMGVVIS